MKYNSGTMFVWKVANNITACYSVAKLTLKVIATNIPPAYNIAPKKFAMTS
jgi:hypothetical protein